MQRLRKLGNFACVLLGVLWTFFIAVACLVAYNVNEKLGHRIQRSWGRGWCRLMDIHVHFHDLENLPRHGAAIIAPNHQSYFDIFILATLPVDFKWVSKVQVARIPLVGSALRAMGSYLVRRDRSNHDLNVMKEVEEGLRSGRNVLIFPEGTRTRTGELLPFKKGAFRTAQNTGVPLCPVAIQGTYAIAPPGELPTRRGHHVDVRVGRPLAVPKGADLGEIMRDYRSALVDLLGRSKGG